MPAPRLAGDAGVNDRTEPRVEPLAMSLAAIRTRSTLEPSPALAPSRRGLQQRLDAIGESQLEHSGAATGHGFGRVSGDVPRPGGKGDAKPGPVFGKRVDNREE